MHVSITESEMLLSGTVTQEDLQKARGAALLNPPVGLCLLLGNHKLS